MRKSRRWQKTASIWLVSEWSRETWCLWWGSRNDLLTPRWACCHTNLVIHALFDIWALQWNSRALLRVTSWWCMYWSFSAAFPWSLKFKACVKYCVCKSARYIPTLILFFLHCPQVLKRPEYFGRFGKIHKVVINNSTSYAGSQVREVGSNWLNEYQQKIVYFNFCNRLFIDNL